MTQNTWKTIKKNLIYQNKYGYKLSDNDVITPSGTEGKYMVFESKGFVGIVGVDKENNVVMEKNWRYPIEKESLEIPAGTIEEGEDPLATAKREFCEETGYVSDEWIKISRYWIGNGAMKIQGHIFLAKNVKTNNIVDNPDKNEVTNISLMNFNELLQSIKSGVIDDDRTIVGLLTAKEYLL